MEITEKSLEDIQKTVGVLADATSPTCVYDEQTGVYLYGGFKNPPHQLAQVEAMQMQADLNAQAAFRVAQDASKAEYMKMCFLAALQGLCGNPNIVGSLDMETMDRVVKDALNMSIVCMKVKDRF